MKRITNPLSLFIVAICLLVPTHSLSIDWFEQGLSLLKSHRYEDAIKAFSKAIEVNVHDAGAYNNRGFAWHEKGAYERAIADYTKAFNVNPRCAEAYNNLAWALAVCPEAAYRNGTKAVDLAQKAVELDPEAYALDTLAAAYAEVSEFGDAVATQTRAIALESQQARTEDLAEYRERLESYRANKPWREQYVAPEVFKKTFPQALTIKVRVGRVREGPSLDSRIKFRLKKGQMVSIVEEKDDWYLIARRTGWAHKSLFSHEAGATEPTLLPSAEHVITATVRVPVGRVREGPALDSRIKFRLKKGQVVSVTERKDEWYGVRLADGRAGWAHKILFFRSD